VLVCNWNRSTPTLMATVLAAFHHPVIMRDVPDAEWRGRMAVNKVPNIGGLPISDGDRVVCLDLDTIVKDDLFRIFDDDFDVAYTSRPVPNPAYPVNAGVWAFRCNERTRRFLRWYRQQVIEPTWKPLIGLQRLRGSFGRTDIFPDQDVLCACAIHGFPFGIRALDIGPKWNWFASDSCPNPREAYRQRASLCRVLHFKGQFKPLMIEPEMDWPPRIELEITLRCNLACPTCNRHCNAYGDLSDSDMTLDQIRRFVRDVQTSGRRYEYIAALGGEPTLHPQFAEVMEILHEGLVAKGYAQRLRIISNGVLPIPESVLDLCPEVVTSDHETKPHYEAFIAPKDTGQERALCSVLRNCGISLSAYGYAPCGPGAAIARLFGLKGFMRKSLPANPGEFGDLEPLCELCQRGAKSPPMLPMGAKATFSESYQTALEAYNAAPPQYDRY